MKKLMMLAIFATSISNVTIAQETITVTNTKQNLKVLYAQSRQNNVRIESPEMTDEMKERMNRVRKTYFELHIVNNESYYKESDKMDANEGAGGGGFGMNFGGMAGNTETYTNLNNKTKTDKTELNETNYLVEDSLLNYNWNFTNETKTILGFECNKATVKILPPVRRMMMGNFGRRTENKVTDSTVTPAKQDSMTVTVWYTKAFPMAHGPNYQGNLPGLILEIDNTFKNNVNVITAESITNDPKTKLVSLPTKGKKLTRTEFTAKRDELMKKMMENMQSSGGAIRIGG
jgi:GLPGLI family protein